MSDYDNIQNALNHIDPQDRETWFRMGAAIKDELGENGFEMWDNWSRQASNYKQTDAQAVWKSIKTGHIHIATLFKAARENGYRPETPYTPPSPEMLAQRTREAQERQRAEAERIAQAHAKAEKTAYGIWKNASPADPKHAYVQNKGLGLNEAAMNVMRQNEYNGKKQLIIPLYSDKKLVNVQIIDEQGNKKFLNGGQKQGAYTIIGDFKQNQNGIVLAEGFATAASVHQATGKPVVVAFDAGNLKAVSEKLLRALPENVPVYFAADNDPNHTGEHKAQAAAEVWGNRAQILLPEFSEKQIAEFQENYGADKMPTDFNDLHKIAGIEAVQRSFGEMLERDFRQPEQPVMDNSVLEYAKPELTMAEKMQSNYWRVQNGYEPLPEQNNPEPGEIRTEWGDFPPVISNGKLGDLKNEPEYSAAKAGDVLQSALLVEKLLKDETVQEIKNLIGDNQPILVPIQSEEASGKNRIPQATAYALAEKLGLSVDNDIFQHNTVKRTDSGIYQRYVSPPEFKGEVQADKSYLIVDDTLSVGGTIAALKGYIENNGGKVIGSTVMTAHELKVNIAIQPNMLQSLQQKQGLNEYWRNEFGYGVDKLTQQEAGHLRKPTLEQIQERVEQAKLAKQNMNLSENKELNHGKTTPTQSVETEMSGVSNLSDGTGISRIETVRTGEREVSQSVFQQEQNTEPSLNAPKSTATSEKNTDVAVSFTAQDNMMKNKDKFELGQAVKHEFPHFTDISLVVGKSPNGYVLLDDEPVRSPYLREVDGTEFQASTDKAWLSSLVYENKNAEKAYEIFEQNQSRFGSEYEWIGKADFMKAFGQQIELEKETTQQTDFRQPENEHEPSFYDYNFEDLPTERPTVAPPQPENPTATSEKDVAVSTSEADEPEQEMPNRIEYDGLQHEIRQPENPTPPKSELETAEPKQEKSQVNTGLDYEVPEHLKSRMVAVDTQRFRVANYEMGAHLLRYVAPDNPKTVLFEDKGKSIHTVRDDKQTIQDMLDVAKAKGWDSIKISGSQEFKQQMWLEAESRGIATKGYKPSPEDLAILEQRRAERATNSIAEAEKLKQQSAVQERSDSSAKTIPTEAVKAADTVKAHATQAQQTTQSSDTAKAQYENKLATLPTDQQHKARFYERLALNALRHMPAEFHEKTRQAIYENQADLIHDGKYHAPDPMKSVERQPEKEKSHERVSSRDDDWEMER